jgi:hypothetical protein
MKAVHRRGVGESSRWAIKSAHASCRVKERDMLSKEKKHNSSYGRMFLEVTSAEEEIVIREGQLAGPPRRRCTDRWGKFRGGKSSRPTRAVEKTGEK